MGDACSRPPTTIKFHNLHAGDIKGAVVEIASYHEKGLVFSLFFGSLQAIRLLAFV